MEEETKKDLSRPITFRADKDTLYRLIGLEKARKESKSEVIKKAIGLSFEILISRKISEGIYLSLKKVFGDISVASINFSMGGINKLIPEEMKDGELFDDILEETGKKMIFYHIKNPKRYKSKNKEQPFEIDLGNFLVEIDPEGENREKIKFSLINVMLGNIKNFDPQLYLKINEFAEKCDLETETKSIRGKESKLNIIYETNFSITSLSNIPKKFEKIAKNVKKFIEMSDKFFSSNNKIRLIK